MTLESSGPNYLSNMISHRMNTTKTKDGAYFIDRDPACFGVILNFLRTGNVILTNNVTYGMLAIECDFYGLDIPGLEK